MTPVKSRSVRPMRMRIDARWKECANAPMYLLHSRSIGRAVRVFMVQKGVCDSKLAKCTT